MLAAIKTSAQRLQRDERGSVAIMCENTERKRRRSPGNLVVYDSVARTTTSARTVP